MEENTMDEHKIKQEVWQTILSMNQLWTIDNKAEELINYFHKNMVAITPTDAFRRVGQASCVAGWKGFSDMAKINYWKELDPIIDLYGNNLFAIVTYRFEMSFDINGQTIEMNGRDMFSLVKENSKWWIVADQYSPTPN
jgi:hypothetical protein